MIPTTLKPKIWSARNYLRRYHTDRRQIWRELIMGIFAIVVMFSIYQGVFGAIVKIKSDTQFVYLHPSIFMGLCLMTLSLILLFSNSVSALGALFTSKDLELLLAAPLNRTNFFFSKLIEVLASSSWMILIFGAPLLIAFSNLYAAGLDFYFWAAIAIFPLLLTITSLAIILTTTLTIVISPNRIKEILIFATGLLIVSVYFIVRWLQPDPSQDQEAASIMHLLSMLTVPHSPWVPSYWPATVVGEALEATGKPVGPYLLTCYSVALMSVSLAYICIRLGYDRAISNCLSNTTAFDIDSFRSEFNIAFSRKIFPTDFVAMARKELRLFLRDMGQAVQMLLLLGLALLYLYNFRVLRVIDNLPMDQRIWWQMFLAVGNIMVGTFVIAAMATRFVFPSISLEGQAFWGLQTAPISLERILKIKFWIWFPVFSIISLVIFLAGAFSVDANPQTILVTVLASQALSYGIVGLAVGMGAIFANFNWENTSQLATSFGSLMFMFASTMFIMLTQVPLILLLYLNTTSIANNTLGTNEWIIAFLSAWLLLMYINRFVTHWSFKTGIKALQTNHA